MPAVIAPTSALPQLAGATEAAPQLVLQPGAVIDARVLAVRDNLARILIAGLSIEVLTEVALQPGTNLKLAVSQTPDGTVKLAVLPQAAQTQAGGPASTGGSGAASVHSAASSVGATAQASPSRTIAAAAPAQATPETAAISQAVLTSAPRQASLSPLFANLPVIVGADGVPQQVQTAAARLLATRPPLDGTLTAGDLRQAFQKSGLFLEATLAQGAAPAGAPDLKAALVVFKQVLTNWLGPAGPAAQSSAAPSAAGSSQPLVQGVSQGTQTVVQPALTPSVSTGAPGLVPDLAAAAGRTLIQPNAAGASPDEASPPGQPRAALPVASQPVTNELPQTAEIVRTATQALARDGLLRGVVNQTGDDPAARPSDVAARPLPQPLAHLIGARQATEPSPPFRGGVPSPQPIASPSLAPDAAPASMGHQLLDQTDAALARQTLLQVASLPDRLEPGPATQATQPRWSFEIPFATPQGTAVAQFEIARDGGNDVEVTASTRVWRARFTLDVEPAGPVHALVSLIGEKTAVRMWAERPETAAQLRANAAALGQALRQAELEPGEILVGEGAPPQPKSRAGRFLDRAT